MYSLRYCDRRVGAWPGGRLSSMEGTGEGAVVRHHDPHIRAHPLPESRTPGRGEVVLGRRLKLTSADVLTSVLTSVLRLTWTLKTSIGVGRCGLIAGEVAGGSVSGHLSKTMRA